MSLRTLMFLAVASAVMIMGCGKKDKVDESAMSSDMPDMSESSTDTSGKSDDIFDEFYSDSDTEDQSSGSESIPDESEETYAYESDYTPSFNPNGPYVVQVSCVGSYEIGEAVVRKLENNGYPAYLAEVENPTPDLLGTYYRVRIGGFNGVSRAKRFAEDFLIPAGYDFWVDNRSNDNVGIGGYGLGETGSGNTGYEEEEYYSEPASDNSAGWGTSTTYDENTDAAESVTEDTYEATSPQPSDPKAAAEPTEESSSVQTPEETVAEESGQVETSAEEPESDDSWDDDEWDDSGW